MPAGSKVLPQESLHRLENFEAAGVFVEVVRAELDLHVLDVGVRPPGLFVEAVTRSSASFAITE